MESVATTTLLSAAVYLLDIRRVLLVREVCEEGNVRRLDCSFEEDADGHLVDRLCSIGVLLYFVDADIVLAVSCGCYGWHYVMC